MATISPPPPTPPRNQPAHGGRGGDPSGGESGQWGDSPGGRSGASDRMYYTGMLVGLGGIIMIFTALTSAMVVRKGLSDDWQSFPFPPILWVNTAILLASSLTLEKARRHVWDVVRLKQWWGLTTLLGVFFLGGQWLVWKELAGRGVYVASNPSSSFFYVLTAAHAIHLLGGVTALIFLSFRVWAGRLGRTEAGVMSLYWHFMDFLWVYVVLLLWIWR